WPMAARGSRGGRSNLSATIASIDSARPSRERSMRSTSAAPVLHRGKGDGRLAVGRGGAAAAVQHGAGIVDRRRAGEAERSATLGDGGELGEGVVTHEEDLLRDD